MSAVFTSRTCHSSRARNTNPQNITAPLRSRILLVPTRKRIRPILIIDVVIVIGEGVQRW